ncbi:TPA: WD40/YVTN/BNR-like repeat-containing protein [Pseudomonas aeruginosa]
MIFFSSYFKRTWMLAVLLAATFASAQDQTFVDPLFLPARLSDRPTEKLLVDIAALGDGRLVAVGEQGTIILSDDKGHGWRQAEVPVSVNLTAVFFFDTRIGWVAGHGGVILGTRDGGQTWTRLFDGNAANAQILAAAQRRLKKVQDRAQGMDEAADSLQDELEQAEEALADAEAGSRFGPSRPLFGLWFKDVRQGFAVGSFGQLFRTDDGGTTWRYIGDRLDNPEGFHYNAIAHTPSGKLAVVGEGARCISRPMAGIAGSAGRLATTASCTGCWLFTTRGAMRFCSSTVSAVASSCRGMAALVGPRATVG